ncbi:hypothetical protein R1sor_018222 [Riccia sorocarpa]|uniref:Uncharacterized protein n=1 Tax=Riccia sorocarpa TaxID=122646 RepID=A0ABD3I920_9MARC
MRSSMRRSHNEIIVYNRRNIDKVVVLDTLVDFDQKRLDNKHKHPSKTKTKRKKVNEDKVKKKHEEPEHSDEDTSEEEDEDYPGKTGEKNEENVPKRLACCHSSKIGRLRKLLAEAATILEAMKTECESESPPPQSEVLNNMQDQPSQT